MKRALVAVALAVALPAVARAEDHKDYSELLKRYVDDKGMVAYKKWKATDADVKTLKAYIGRLGAVDDKKLSRDEKLAFYINAYNAITIEAMLEYYPLPGIKDAPVKVWTKYIRKVAGQDLSLDDIEHKILRKMSEPRIHFAIVCASKGCPYLRPEAFTAASLDTQLTEQVQKALADTSKFKVDKSKKKAYVTPLLDWFGDDFGSSEAQRLTWLAKFVKDAEEKKVLLDSDTDLKFLDWDWSLNEK